MKTIFKLSILLILVSSCVTEQQATDNFRRIMNEWVGHDVNEMIDSWGPPQNVYVMSNGNKVYTWERHSSPMAMSNYNYHAVYTYSFQYWCKTNFTVSKHGTIIGWNAHGNACKSY